ncbi:MAG: dTDP-4-dehydrorhamnose reductase [Bacteroidales bacterium]|jgi:dTDP-4-dehydrorhamnose reductase|nr:dTDP-4-dehydrorhamnose reductase [Bacteroidales bacterium]MDD3130721.1 dTDP-4-dehydrorhamnose reductase [Bacteroidales bacterium]MDY0335786.1 dTDP-4-dehydrorhamnose reductase [Bacteroidales bacterium]NCU36286.1 dTDP-4-dehydrorhamnose reductase [Candidatus Falkowbacteria bacterium]
MFNILVTGSNGQLGNSIREIAGSFPQYHFHFTDIDELDITDAQAVKKMVKEHDIRCIMNAAAYNAVDRAESEPQVANLLNAEAVGNLALAAAQADALFIHVSTDYVFDGTSHQPISEDQVPKPISAYARSKYAGEQQALSLNKKTVVVRTSWLYSEYGSNFMKSMIRLGKEREALGVVYDQIGTPTYAGDLADALLLLLPEFDKLSKPEIFHYSNEGVAGWYDFAVAIHKLAGITCNVKPIRTSEYPLPAPRPMYSVMAKEKIKNSFGITIPHWRESLERCMTKFLQM